jgi:hypothetical protein
MLTEWILALMLKAEPSPPWRATYERTASAIAKAAHASPLFEGEHGAEKTAALIVGVAWFESAFKPDAAGDCTDAKGAVLDCRKPGAIPHSFCALQVSETNFKGLGTTREEVQTDIDACIRHGLRLMHQSFAVCRSAPLEERLTWYASGGPTCSEREDARRKARHRFLKGQSLFRSVVLPEARAIR